MKVRNWRGLVRCGLTSALASLAVGHEVIADQRVETTVVQTPHITGVPSPVSTGAPSDQSCSECEYQKRVREVRLALENARHEAVVAELELAIKLNREFAESARKLMTDAANGLHSHTDRLEGPWYTWVEKPKDYWWKVAKNFGVVIVDVAASRAGVPAPGKTAALTAGGVACKAVQIGKGVVSKLGSPQEVSRFLGDAAQRWFGQVEKKGPIVYSAGVVGREGTLQGNIKEPNWFEVALPWIPVVGSSYQAGAQLVKGPLDQWQVANQLITRADVYAQRVSQLSDEYWELRKAKKEAERIHTENIEQIERESTLWEIPGCCVRWDGAVTHLIWGDGLESDPCRGRSDTPAPVNVVVAE